MVLKKPLRNFFPNFKAILRPVPTRMPLRKMASPEALFKTKTLQFTVDRSMNKITFREYLQKVYGLEVAKIDSVNLPGKAKRNPAGKGFYRTPDIKKMFVTLPHWVQVPFAPRKRSDYEHSISHSDENYALRFRRPSFTPDEVRRLERRAKIQRNRYDPAEDPVYKPRKQRFVPTRDTSKD